MSISYKDAKIGKNIVFLQNTYKYKKLYTKKIYLLVVGLLTAIIMPAQDLPVLPADPAVKKGALPNGMTYYVVPNKSIKGVADFALVQKTGLENVDDPSVSTSAVAIARDALASLPRCLNPSAQTFFTSHGVTPGKDGFVKVTENATEFRFSNVMVSSKAVLDSTLLVIMDIVDRVSTSEDPFVQKWYSPSDQAVVVSGDIDPSAVIEKLNLLSLMTPSVPSSPRKEYTWKTKETAEYQRVPVKDRNLASFMVTWRSSRTPRETMNTVQPVIYEMFLEELSVVVEESLRKEMKERNIPVENIVCNHVNSYQSAGDEIFSIGFSVYEKDYREAVRTVSKVLSDIDCGLTDGKDLVRIKRSTLGDAQDVASRYEASNSEYVDNCITAFLYNGSLATFRSKVNFLAERKLSDEMELKLFNNISGALIDPEKNVSITYSPDLEPYTIRNLFMSGWNEDKPDTPGTSVYTIQDIPEYIQSQTEKIKVVSEKSDPISKGTEWTFSNGIKVVYKKMATNGNLHYNFALNGGTGSVADIKTGEAGYISDFFFLSDINGIPSDDFLNMIASEGISMDLGVSLTSMSIKGSAPTDNARLLLNSLLAVTNSRVSDKEAVDYYMAGEGLRSELRKGTLTERTVKINQIMCPDYIYVSHKMLDTLSQDLYTKAEDYYNKQLAKMDDGLLVLVGDMDVIDMKRMLLDYVGGFPTEQKTFKRSLVRYQPSTGWSTYTVDGDCNSVDIALSVPLALTSDNYMAAEIAAMILKKNLAEAIIETGMYLMVTHESRIYPSERLNIHIALNEISADGFSSGVHQTGPIEALSIVRSALSDFSDQQVVDADVAAFKGQLKDRLKLDMNDPLYWLDAIAKRHLAGKDFTTGYEARIDGLTPDKVRDILSRLNEGTRVEFITRKK